MTTTNTLIYPQKLVVGRAESRSPDATKGGPVPNVPPSQGRASSGPCPASLTTLPLEEDPRPSWGGRINITKTSKISGFSQNQHLGTDPNIFTFFQLGLRPDSIPGGDLISFRLTLGFRKRSQASRSLQRSRIRENACFPRRSQAHPGGPIRLPGHPPRGSVPRYPPTRAFLGCSRPVSGSIRGRCHP